MRIRFYLSVAAACLLCTGCELATNLACNTAYEIGRCTNEKLEMLRNAKLAREAWEEEKESCPDEARSEDYGAGFRAGYKDYLFAGGTGEPPPFPPPRYWCLRNESPEGCERMQEWFAGFRRGAAAAKASGFRNLVVLPMSAPKPAGPPVPYAVVPPSAAAPAVAAPATPAPAAETLPPPQKVPEVPATKPVPPPEAAPALPAVPPKEEAPRPQPPAPPAAGEPEALRPQEPKEEFPAPDPVPLAVPAATADFVPVDEEPSVEIPDPSPAPPVPPAPRAASAATADFIPVPDEAPAEDPAASSGAGRTGPVGEAPRQDGHEVAARAAGGAP